MAVGLLSLGVGWFGRKIRLEGNLGEFLEMILIGPSRLFDQLGEDSFGLREKQMGCRQLEHLTVIKHLRAIFLIIDLVYCHESPFG